MLLAIVLVVILFLSLDTMIRVTMEHNIRKQTGMDAEIGKFHLGLTEPVLTIKNLKLHNSPAFGGTPFLEIPEVHVEYDRAALKAGTVRLVLSRRPEHQPVIAETETRTKKKEGGHRGA